TGWARILCLLYGSVSRGPAIDHRSTASMLVLSRDADGCARSQPQYQLPSLCSGVRHTATLSVHEVLPLQRVTAVLRSGTGVRASCETVCKSSRNWRSL